MHLTVPTTDSFVSLTARTEYILLCFSLIYIPSSAYRRKTTNAYGEYTKPVRPTKRRGRPKTTEGGPTKPKAPKKKSDGLDYDEGALAGGDGDVDEAGDMDYDDTDGVEAGWLDDMKEDTDYDEDTNMLLTSVTPIDFETDYQTKSSIQWTEYTEEMTTIPTTTVLMDLKLIGFNETWCTYVNQTEALEVEGEAFVNAVQKLCSEEHAEDNDLRIALKHTFVNRKVIDKLMNNIVARLSENDEEKKHKILHSKHKVNTQNEFCFGRAMKTFKYICFDPDANPYMQRYLKVLSNGCRLPGVDIHVIRDHLMEACNRIDNNLSNVL